MQHKLRTAEQQFDEQRALALSVKFYPKESIPDDFKKWLHLAMRYTSQYRLGCNDLTYDALVKFHRDFVMPEIQLGLNILKGATPIELDQTLEENLDMLQNIHRPMLEKWFEINDEISEPIRRKIQAQEKLTQAVPETKKLYVQAGV